MTGNATALPKCVTYYTFPTDLGFLFKMYRSGRLSYFSMLFCKNSPIRKLFLHLQVHEFSIKNHAKIGHRCPIFVYFNKTIYIKAGLHCGYNKCDPSLGEYSI